MRFNRGLRILFALLIMLVGNRVLWGQNVSIQAKLDRHEILTGEQAIIDVIIRTDDLANTRFYQEERKGEEERFQILEFAPIDTIRIDDRVMEIQARMLITSFDSTFITIPPIIVETPSGKSQSDALGLRVHQPDVDVSNPDKYFAEKDLWAVNLSFWEWLKLILFSKWALALYALIAISLISYILYRRHKSKPPKPICEAQPLVYVPTDYEKAISDLKSLEASSLLEEGLYKEYYTRLVDIVKTYVDARKGWNLQEQTTRQVLETLSADDEINAGVISSVREILLDADLSKFARNTPALSDASRSLELASSVVTALEEVWKPLSSEAERSIQ